MEQNSDKLSLEEVMKRAMEAANRANINEPPLKWPEPQEKKPEREKSSSDSNRLTPSEFAYLKQKSAEADKILREQY